MHIDMKYLSLIVGLIITNVNMLVNIKVAENSIENHEQRISKVESKVYN